MLKSWKIAYPIVIGNLVQMLLGVIDSAMVGSINANQLAAASLVNSVLAVPMVFGFGLSMAVGPLVASAVGEGKVNKPLEIMFNGFIISGILAFIFAIIMHWYSGIVYHLGQDPIVAKLGEPYLILMAWSMVPFILFMVVKQFSEGLEYTRLPMIISLIALPLNFIVNYIFIFGVWGAPRMELTGAGIGTLVSRIFILIALIWCIFRHKNYARFRTNVSHQLRYKYKEVREMIRIGIPSGLQYGMETGAFALSGIMVGWIGAEQQAAHQIALSLAGLTFMVSLGLSAAGSVRVGQTFGRKDWHTSFIIGRNILFMGIVYGTIMAIFFIVFRDDLPYIFNQEKDVIYYASLLLILAAIFQISDSVQAISVGLLRGIQDVNIPTIIVGIAYWGIGLPSGYYFAFYRGMESRGIWLGFVVGLSASAILLVTRFILITRRRASSITHITARRD